MPMYNRAEVATLAAKYGFQRDTRLEKERDEKAEKFSG